LSNRPLNDPTPSEADIKVTCDLIRAGQVLKIEITELQKLSFGMATLVSFSSRTIIALPISPEAPKTTIVSLFCIGMICLEQFLKLHLPVGDFEHSSNCFASL
jgi:hypothetical protein